MSRRVSDLIGEEPVMIHAVPAALTVTEAAKKMVKKHVASLIVKQGGKYVGIITERDMAQCVSACKDLTTARVEDVMSKDIRFITPDITLVEAAQIMHDQDVRHLPVFDGQSVIFMLSIRDIAFDDLPGQHG